MVCLFDDVPAGAKFGKNKKDPPGYKNSVDCPARSSRLLPGYNLVARVLSFLEAYSASRVSGA